MQHVADLRCIARLGLSDGEYERITAELGREPNAFELAVYSLLWSEHCGYKHSALLLRRLPPTARACCRARARTPGVIDVGDGLAVAFKVESHNHPSAVEPFQGAATGVGGILRDIFAMGARPIALLDSLRFGALGSERAAAPVRRLRPRHRPLRQLRRRPERRRRGRLRAGLRAQLPRQRDVRRRAAGGRPAARARPPGRATCVVLFGARTGRDGIGGASVLASQDIDRATTPSGRACRSATRSPSKKLIECSLELRRARRCSSSLQDLGAAGLASSTSEMARKGGVGLELDLDRVPLPRGGHGAVRDHDLRVAGADGGRGRARAAREVRPSAPEWELASAVIGRVVEGDTLVCRSAARSSASCRSRVARRRLPALRLAPGASPSGSPTEPLDPARATRARRPRRRRCWRCWPRRTSRSKPGSTGSTTSTSAAARSCGPAPTRASCALDAVRARDRRQPRRQRPPRLARPAPRRAPRPSARRPATSPARRARRSRSRTASTSATRSAARRRTRCVEAIDGHRPRPARRSACRSSRGNVSLYNETRGDADPADADVGCLGVLDAAVARASATPVPRGRRRRAADGRPGAPRSTAPSTSARCTAASRAASPAPDLGRRARGSAALLADARPPRACCALPTTSPTAALAVAIAECGVRPRARRRCCPTCRAAADVTLFGEASRRGRRLVPPAPPPTRCPARWRPARRRRASAPSPTTAAARASTCARRAHRRRGRRRRRERPRAPRSRERWPR